MMKPRILFIGGTPRGRELLKLLVHRREKVVFAVILKEDDHETVKVSDSIASLCQKNNISSVICKKITPSQITQILKLKPAIALVCGWRTLLPNVLYQELPLGCIAAHDSLLPKYRGFAPLNWAIINGEKLTGVTLFKISNNGVDAGNIFRQKSVAIGPNETAAVTYPRIIKVTIELYKEFLTKLKDNTLKWRLQDESQATYTCKRTPEDGEIDWNKSARVIFNLIRALSPPYPCAWTRYNGEKIYIESAYLPKKQLKYSGNIPGRIVSIQGDGVLILCGKGQIVITGIIVSDNKHVRSNEFFSSIVTKLGV